MTEPSWRQKSPQGKMSDGLNPSLVMVLAVVVFGAIVLALALLLYRSLGQDGQSFLTREGAIPATEEETPAIPTPAPTPLAEVALPPIRGYILFGTRTETVDRAEAYLAKDRNRIVVLVYRGSAPERPVITFAFDLRPNTDRCDIESLRRNRIVVNPPGGNTGPRMPVSLVRLPDAPDEFPEIQSFSCIRSPGGELELSILGSNKAERPQGNESITYGIAVRTTMK